jgi:sulfur carrier protein
MSSSITVLVGGEKRRLPSGSTLAELLAALDHEPAAVATAVNGEFVARGARAERLLVDGDRVHCFKPITGG